MNARAMLGTDAPPMNEPADVMRAALQNDEEEFVLTTTFSLSSPSTVGVFCVGNGTTPGTVLDASEVVLSALVVGNVH